MDVQASRAAKIVAVSLIATVALQIAYMAFLGGPRPAEAGNPLTGADVVRYFDERGSEITTVWMIEAVAFLGIAIGSLVALARGAPAPFAWAALALAGVFNMVQIGFGLSMFEPAARIDDSGELFFVFVSGAFFFYFAAKLAIGIAGVFFGLHLFGESATGAKLVGGAAFLLGLAAVATALTAMAIGNPALFAAGAAGTVAALFVAVAAGLVAKRGGA